ncbi:2-nitropropane dioxygenase [Gonapodya prolifera JEL478]|uniref:2-nitropropane dioxygenase n=1 Tax=Gonapodya prolifera (strain JEL478) TaxID=1344416 RepID=A0A139A947_GONPJ|nr:2-nitropropane dioxygenase [Gonapodya prolifera JEL478]|eukprot:KXS12923.1 2-nitropropane dioxygenase [Gonapodya prolifera JEL478]
MPFRTRLTEMLGIEHPIVQGGMMWVGTAEMASAVSNAGGLGIITGLTQPTPEALRKEIARCKTMTSKPFGVNLTIFPTINAPPYAEYVKVIIDSGVRIVETAGTSAAAPFIKQFKDAGCKILHKCTSIRHAKTAIRLGADVISVDGFECAGHPGEDDIGGLILLCKAFKELSVPYIASGGIGTGAGLAAALAMGADGVNMGTRFMCTVESPIHQSVKEKIVKADERDTSLIFRKFHNTARVFKNKVAVEVVSKENKPNANFDDVKDLVAGTRGRVVYDKGDIDHGIWWAGQVVGLIDDIPTCKDLVARMVGEAEEIATKRLAGLVVRPRL